MWGAAARRLRRLASIPRAMGPGAVPEPCHAAPLPLREGPLLQRASSALATPPFSQAGGSAWLLWQGLPWASPGAAQQRRGYAGPAFNRRRRPEVMPDRNLPMRNEQITAPEVRLVYPEEERRATEVLPVQQAIRAARERGLDLVLVSGGASPPVCRIVEWDKVLYEQRKKAKATAKVQREHKRLSEAKEVRVGCHIADHDMEMKMAQARRFLGDQHHLRLVVTFRGGREVQRAREVLGSLLQQLEGVATVKDQRHLQRPQQNQWAVQLAPVPPPKPAAVLKPPKPARQLDAAPEGAPATAAAPASAPAPVADVPAAAGPAAAPAAAAGEA